MLKIDKKRKTKVSIFQNICNDKEYKATTGLSHTEFNILYEMFEKLYISKNGSSNKNLYSPLFSDKREALFFILYYLKTYVTYQVLGVNFGISEASAHNYVHLLKPILKQCLETFSCQPVRVFASQEAFDKFFEGVEIDIDVTENPTQRPCNQDKQENNYSGKKRIIQKNG